MKYTEMNWENKFGTMNTEQLFEVDISSLNPEETKELIIVLERKLEVLDMFWSPDVGWTLADDNLTQLS